MAIELTRRQEGQNAFDRCVEVLASCKNAPQLQVARQMTFNFSKHYDGRMFYAHRNRLRHLRLDALIEITNWTPIEYDQWLVDVMKLNQTKAPVKLGW